MCSHCGTNQNATGNIIARTQRDGDGVTSGSSIHGCNGGGNPTWPNITTGFGFRRNIVLVPEQGALTEPGRHGAPWVTTAIS